MAPCLLLTKKAREPGRFFDLPGSRIRSPVEGCPNRATVNDRGIGCDHSPLSPDKPITASLDKKIVIRARVLTCGSPDKRHIRLPVTVVIAGRGPIAIESAHGVASALDLAVRASYVPPHISIPSGYVRPPVTVNLRKKIEIANSLAPLPGKGGGAFQPLFCFHLLHLVT